LLCHHFLRRGHRVLNEVTSLLFEILVLKLIYKHSADP